MVDIFNPEKFREFEGDLIPTRVKQIQEQRKKENEAKLQRQFDYEKKMSEQREKVFLKFSYMFLNPNIFSNLYSNCSDLLGKIRETSRNKLKKHSVTKIVLNKLF